MFRSNLSRSNQSWVGFISCLVVALCFGTPATAREKVDVVYLKNGDRITGEIISLEYGELRISTDSMAKVAIEWPDVARVVSAQNFVVEDDIGGRFHGSLGDKAPREQLSVQISPGEGAAVELPRVTRIAPTEETFFKRLEGSFSVGFDYAKASEITTLAGAANFAFRAPDYQWAIDFDTNSTKDPEQGTLERANAGFHYQWYLPDRLFWSGIASLERNEETGIEARLLVGGGIGRYFYQTARAEVTGNIGLVGLDEWATGSDDSRTSIEAVIGGSWRIFKFNSPKVSLNTTTLLYHSLTESSRDRAKVNFSLRQEVISDFFVDVSVYYSYDSEPPDVAAEKDDYGVTTSLGYSFN